jgi:hypothetical protein
MKSALKTDIYIKPDIKDYGNSYCWVRTKKRRGYPPFTLKRETAIIKAQVKSG